MAISGIPLPTFEEGTFRRVPPHLRRNPGASFDLAERLGERVTKWVRDCYGTKDKPKLLDVVQSIPMKVYRTISLDELCKVKYSSRFMFDESVEEAFKTEPQLRVYRKIVNSMWRWGVGEGDWNEIVDCYEGIRSFDIGHPDFEIRLDHSTSYNERGLSEFSGTFLDGTFGYLVHYKGEHVMTLGFSLMEKHRLLIQQVQMKNRSGNRWLFKLPKNYLEHAIDRFAAAFPNHALHLVDGEALMKRNLDEYRGGLAKAESRIASYTKTLANLKDEESRSFYEEALASSIEDVGKYRETIAHGERDLGRLGAFYASSGKYVRGKPLTVNGLKHYEISAPKS